MQDLLFTRENEMQTRIGLGRNRGSWRRGRSGYVDVQFCEFFQIDRLMGHHAPPLTCTRTPIRRD